MKIRARESVYVCLELFLSAIIGVYCSIDINKTTKTTFEIVSAKTDLVKISCCLIFLKRLKCPLHSDSVSTH